MDFALVLGQIFFMCGFNLPTKWTDRRPPVIIFLDHHQPISKLTQTVNQCSVHVNQQNAGWFDYLREQRCIIGRVQACVRVYIIRCLLWLDHGLTRAT